MRFLVDAQLPPALAVWLRDRGHEAEHVAEIAMSDAADAAIARRARETGAVLDGEDDADGLGRALGRLGQGLNLF